MLYHGIVAPGRGIEECIRSLPRWKAEYSLTVRGPVPAENAAALMRIPGVGRKTAERLIVEMKDRLDASAPAGTSAAASATGAEAEASSALVALGYKPQEATRLLKSVDTEGQKLTTDEMIRRALQGSAPT